MSDEHFTVDGTLIDAWASQKSFQCKDGDPDGDGRNFRGQERKSDTHASTTDPDARLYRRSNQAESRLAYLGHGSIADAMATIADGFAEREAATRMVCRQWQQAPGRRRTVGADKGYDVSDFVGLMRELGTTPHVTQNLTRQGGSAIDGRTTGTSATPRASTRGPASKRLSAGSRRLRGCGKLSCAAWRRWTGCAC